MKLNKQHIKRAKGMTLLELTVVILVLLSLISILFIGARAWKKGSDRSANIMNIRNAQQAMRGAQNMYQLEEGDAFPSTTTAAAPDLIDYMTLPTSPTGVATDIYTPTEDITALGELYLGPGGELDTGGEYGFQAATEYADW